MLTDILRLLRPKQWTKNLVVFAGVIFAQRLGVPSALFLSLLAFASFCLASSGIYVLNDVVDRKRDRLHPTKRDRPIAAGRISVPLALSLSLVLTLFSWGLGLLTSRAFLINLLAYQALMVAYSFWLRDAPVVDVMSIAAGFVLRATAGAEAIQVTISPWLVLCTSFLALFLALNKRRAELVVLTEAAAEHRPTLAAYDLPFVDALVLVAATCTLMSYCLYTLAPQTMDKFPAFGGHGLAFSAVFVVYGVLRYMYLVRRKGEGAQPERILLSDLPLIAAIILWLAAVTFVVYGS